MEIFKIVLPKDVEFILNKIENEGFSAYVVGGSIRNQLINQIHNENFPIKDWDITTNCSYDKLKEIFKGFSIEEVGRSFGVLIVKINEQHYELALYREDGEYSDNRRPNEVKFTNDLKSDIARRDFCCNGICYSPSKGLIDYYNGVEDIKMLVLRFIGEPEDRLNEDMLRYMRMFRFATQYNMVYPVIDFEKYNKKLLTISKERIRDEFNKILIDDNCVNGLRNMIREGVLQIIIPELENCVNFNQNNSHHNKDLMEHLLETVKNTKPILINRLSAILHDIGKVQTHSIDDKGESHYYMHHKVSADMSEIILKRLKYDNKTIEVVKKLIYNHMGKSDKQSNKSIKKFILRVGEENLENMFNLLYADIMAHKPPHNLESLECLKQKCYDMINREEPIYKSQLCINGKDLIELGYKQGKIIGEILDRCMELVLNNPENNNKEFLVNKIIEGGN